MVHSESAGRGFSHRPSRLPRRAVAVCGAGSLPRPPGEDRTQADMSPNGPPNSIGPARKIPIGGLTNPSQSLILSGMDSSPSSSRQPSRPSNKNACPICGQDKTSWSIKCSTCEANRQRYLASIEHAEDDITFLQAVSERGQSAIARERRVSRQAINQQVQKARRRLDFLAQHPLPSAATSIPA